MTWSHDFQLENMTSNHNFHWYFMCKCVCSWMCVIIIIIIIFLEKQIHTQRREKWVLTQKHTTIPLKNHFHHLYHILLIDHFHHLYQILLHYCLTVFTVYQFAKIISYDLFSFPFFWERKLVMIFNVKNCIIKFNTRDTT